MNPIGRDLCPRCRGDVLRLPTDSGAQEFDAVVYPMNQVDVADRYVVLPEPCAIHPDPNRAPPATCLRLHHWPPNEPAPLPREDAAPSSPNRADYRALSEVATRISLYRAQQTGRLRPHPGQRTYGPEQVNRRLADLGRLDSTHCPLCRRQCDPDETTLLVGHITSEPPQPLRACAPSCPPRPQAT